MTDLQRRTLERAEAALSIGVREEGGPNHGPQVRLYLAWAGLSEGQPWCASFCGFEITHAAAELKIPCAWPRTGSSSAIYRWAEAHGHLLPGPVPGCVGLLRGGPTGHEHTFLVRAVNPDGTLDGIDGNWHDRVCHSRHPTADADFVEIA